MGRCVYCRKSSDLKNGISVHKFPVGKKEKEQWIKNMGWSDWTPTPYAVICSEHFEKNCLDKRDKNYRRRKGSIPTLFNNNKEDTMPNVCNKTAVPSDEWIKAVEDYVVQKRLEFNEVISQPISSQPTVWEPSLCDKQTGVKNDHCYMYSPEVLHRRLDAAHKKIRKLVTIQRNLIKKQKRWKLNINNLKHVILD